MKKLILEAMLEHGIVNISVAPNSGAEIPDEQWEKFPGGIPLNISWGFQVPLDINDDGVSTTLSFSGVNHDVFVPWGAIYVIKSGTELHMWAPESRASSDDEEDVVDSEPSKPILRIVT
jgi:stringent starvation protein B